MGRPISIFWLLPVLVAGCAGQAEVNLADGLSASEAVALALARNPELLATRKGQAVAQAQVAQSRWLPSPQLRYGISEVAVDPGDLGARRSNVGLRWSPPRPGELGLKGEIARSKVQEVENTIATSEQKLAAEVRLLHATAILLDEQIAIAEQSVRLREAILETVVAQLKAGTKSVLDRSVAELALADARAIPERYRLERSLQLARLAAKLDWPRTHEIKLQAGSDPLEYRSASLDRERLIARALEHRGELKAADARCRQSELAAKAAGRERYPWISFVQLNRRLESRYDAAGWGFQIGLDLPLFRWRGGSTAASSAELERSRLERQGVKAAIAAEIDELRLRLESVGRELRHYRDAMEPASDRDVELAHAALAEGEADAVEPLLAQARRLHARLVYVTKLMEVKALEIGLDQALGDAD